MFLFIELLKYDRNRQHIYNPTKGLHLLLLVTVRLSQLFHQHKEAYDQNQVPRGSGSTALAPLCSAALWQKRAGPRLPAIYERTHRLKLHSSDPWGQTPTSRRQLQDHGGGTRSHLVALPARAAHNIDIIPNIV